MAYTQNRIDQINAELKNATPAEIVQWALSVATSPVVTTNFRPYEAAILHAVCSQKNDIKVIWCDTGYNTPDTYRCARNIIELLQPNIQIYVPKQTAAYRDIVMGIPSINDPLHSEFSEQVKLEPFRRAMAEHNPDVWFTNLRKGQTEHRNTLDIVSQSADGKLKVSPFYNYSDEELDEYMNEHQLPNEFKYFDPTKALANRECGIHI